MAIIKFEDKVTIEEMSDNEFLQAFSLLLDKAFDSNNEEVTLTHNGEEVETNDVSVVDNVEEVAINGKAIDVKTKDRSKKGKKSNEVEKKKSSRTGKEVAAKVLEEKEEKPVASKVEVSNEETEDKIEVSDELVEDLKVASTARTIVKKFIENGITDKGTIKNMCSNFISNGVIKDLTIAGDDPLAEIMEKYDKVVGSNKQVAA